MAGQFLKGAFIQLKSAMLAPVPNVIVFQYNPETLERRWSPKGGSASGADGDSCGAGTQSDSRAAGHLPTESYTLKLLIDANDPIAAGNPVSIIAGVYPRISALELLVFPEDAGALELLAEVVKTGSTKVPRAKVAPVLFVWGPGRVVPVRVTSLSITEKLFDTKLNPTHAEVGISFTVLTPEELKDPSDEIAKTAYLYTHALRGVLAIANLGDVKTSVMGMLPV